MPTRFYLCLALLAATPVWAQLQSTPFEIPAAPIDEQMQTPPPVSNKAYPTTVGSQTRSNYLSAGLTLNTAYSDNVVAGATTTPVGDVIYSILPTIAIDQTTARLHSTLTYIPGFTFYQHTSELNAADQTATLNLQYRLSPHTTVSVNDSFQKSSNVFNQVSPLSGGALSGSTQTPPASVIVPFADQLSNIANFGISYQFNRNRMVGASGIVTVSNYPNPDEASGLYNSNSLGGSGFYSQRLSLSQYIGATYQYLKSQGNPADAQANPANMQIGVQTHTFLPFYTIYLSPTLSLSLSGGPQYFNATQYSSPSVRSWKPSAMASIGWQRDHTNFVGSYSRTVTGSVGLPGAFESNSASASMSLQIARTWTVGLNFSYFIDKNVTPSFPSSSPGGHTVSGATSIQHLLSEHLRAEFGYVHLHQSYSDITAISNAPDTNREFVSVSYQFTRSLGR
jgi:hypothetical protein